MKSAFVLTILSFLIAPTSSGQYQLLTRGQSSAFDSAVAIRIDRYRLEGIKLKLADTLIHKLTFESLSRERERWIQDSTIRAQALVIHAITANLIGKDSTISEVNRNYNLLYRKSIEAIPRKWFEDPWKVAPAAFCLGIVIETILIAIFH